MKFGLIGERLGHSYSGILHGLLAEYEYSLLSMPSEAIPAFMEARELDGFNVTIPYKQTVIPYLTEMSDIAREIGSVNTVLRRKDGTLYGDNTDAYGFEKLCDAVSMDCAGKKVLVLGSGGTSRTVCCVLRRRGGCPVVISRYGENNYDHLDRHRDAAYLVNTTPVGMYPNVEAAPVDLAAFPLLRGVVDVIYNPMRTRLLQQAEGLGIPSAGGLRMLVYQAVRAAEQFTGQPIFPEKAARAEAVLRASALNLVLVGMPGCGKTTVGEILSRLLGREAVDIDREIVRESGKSIPEIFAEDGEEAFRDMEARIIARYSRETGRILLTGGGAVLRKENRENLKQNGFVVHLTRDLALLAMNGRPLSTDRRALESLWQQRSSLYQTCADAEIENHTTPEDCAARIQEAWNEAIRSEWPQSESAGDSGAGALRTADVTGAGRLRAADLPQGRHRS